MSQQQLMRSESERMIAGVCGGLADYLNVDPVFVRLAFVVLSLASGIGIAIYLILWIVMPSEAQSVSAAIVMDDKMETDPAALKAGNKESNNAATIGILLVLLGGFFLMSQLGWVSGAFWPIVLIGAGLFLVLRRNR